MLGVRRPTVTLVIAQLARAGIRERVRIVNRPGLEAATSATVPSACSSDRVVPALEEQQGMAVAR